MDPAPPFHTSAPHSSLLHTTSATWDEQPFFDAAPYAALLLNAQGEVVKHNRAFQETCAPADEAFAIGTDPVKVLGVRDEASALALRMRIGRALAGEVSLTLPLVLLRNPRVPVHVNATVSALQTPPGSLTGAFISLIPVAEPVAETVPGAQGVQVDEALFKAERRYRLMADALQDSCIFIVDAQGKISEWSESAHRLHGFTRDQIQGMSLSALHVVLHGEEEELSSHDALRLAAERGQWEVHGWRRRAHGEPFWGHTLLTALRGEDGTIEGLSCITRDMTVARDLDRVMNDLNAELERRVSERVRQYLVPNRDLDVFTHHITHDLRAPLRHINTFAGLIIEGTEDLSPHAELARYREGLRTGARRLDNMVESLLNYARLGRIDLHPAALAVSALVQSAIERVRCAYPGVAVSFVVQGDLPVVVGDAKMLGHLMFNVIENAVKFSARARSPEVQIGWSPEGDGLAQFFVVDNGVGFDVSKASNLFVMFSRQHHSIDFAGDGTGLAIAQRIVQRHNGRIWADSSPNTGCTVYFTLPVNGGTSSSTPGSLADLPLGPAG
ncbi:sensor histidine kinase [Hydrogenophaga sp. BPS33]|uniref:sensor histidine kinase n=1 Tax=Hydrogenophaga sp. BPS33 TaxID=2651974 RepID=UPI0013202259|nr:ATP-binding protein [Hydrogenophaga sp. BPS33]QHE89238.1 PAS domain-containing protein [Hydrogenophaga sp. BPS33]